MSDSVPVQYFIDLYEREADPWQFETSDYERRKYEATLESLPRARYGTALEIGCSVGIFTGMLARRCDEVLAIDVSERALARARLNCARFSNIRFECRAVPSDYPSVMFDLTTICEVGYYLCSDDLLALCGGVVEHSPSSATVVLVHWTPHVEGHASSTERVHEVFRAARSLRWLHGFTTRTYRLDVLERM